MNTNLIYIKLIQINLVQIKILSSVNIYIGPGLKVIKLFFMLSSAETKTYPAHKCYQRTIGPENAHLKQ